LVGPYPYPDWKGFAADLEGNVFAGIGGDTWIVRSSSATPATAATLAPIAIDTGSAERFSPRDATDSDERLVDLIFA
jgi:hypothetical protein